MPMRTRPALKWRRFAGACLLTMAGGLTAALPASAQGVDVLTFHYDNARLGWNAQETRLTPETVRAGGFGQRWHTDLDGKVTGSPLLVTGLEMAGGKADVVFAGTESDSVYALDAGTGKILWSRRRIAPPLTETQFSGNWFDGPTHGILSTPVIDRAANTLYACGVRARGLRQVFEVFALDIRTGEARPGFPVALKGTYKSGAFEGGQVMQRGALILVNGWVYIPFGGRGDTPPWRGWVMGVDTQHPSAPQRAFCSSPITDGAGIWSGGGLAGGANGDLFAITGNGDYDLDTHGDNAAQSVLRLTTEGDALTFSRQPKDFYTPANHKFLDEQDEDLGGATALLLPDMPDTTTPHLLFTGGKDGLAYLLDRDNLGGLGGETQKFRLFSDPKAVYHEGIRSTSAYFDAGDKGRFIFVAGDQPGPDNALGIAALQLITEAGKPAQLKRVWTLKKAIDGPSSPVVSSNGKAQGVIWVVETANGDDSALRAYDALTGAELYGSDKSPADHLQDGRRFTSPVVANGCVFIGASGVYCYGLKDAAPKAANSGLRPIPASNANLNRKGK